jgi:hypothetical protein
MKIVYRLSVGLIISLLLSSCQFQCKVGDVNTKEKPVATPVHAGGTTLYNGIKLDANVIAVNKAYLIFENGERVPDDNFVEFTNPVKIIILIDSGWTEENDKVWLGASEKVVTEDGTTILDEQDLFGSSTEGFPAKDAKIINLSVSLKPKKGAPPTHYTIYYRVWDKKGKGYVEGSYKLYSK